MRNWMIGWKKSLAKTEKEAVTGGDQVFLIPTSRLRLHHFMYHTPSCTRNTHPNLLVGSGRVGKTS